MHGYQANAELERREIRDWAAMSRPQIYYSLEKLTRMGLLRKAADKTDAAGPERQVFAATPEGKAALRTALGRADWTTQRDKPAFQTWMAMSWQAPLPVAREQLRRRREFLEQELIREKETLASIFDEVGHRYHEAVWTVSLMIAQFETELAWLARVEKEIGRRAPAKKPGYVEK